MPASRRRRLARAAVLSRLVIFALIPLVPPSSLTAQELSTLSVEPAAPVQQADPPAETCSTGEITSARGRDMKLFRNEDCTYTALYGHYLHYQKAPGQWEEVDLNFRQDGADYVMDRHDIEVRITGAVLKATERETGKGIRWVMPMQPVVAGRSARFAAGGLQWEYTTTKSGLKLSATVPAPLGQRTWEFPYQLVGGAAGLSVDEEGNLLSDAFSVPRPYALGADGRIYEVAEWRLLPGSRVAFEFDDSTLPPEAFPYELDPTTTFSVAAGADDGHVGRTANVYPPPNIGNATVETSTSTISAIRSVIETCQPSPESTGGDAGSGAWGMALCPEYEIRNVLVRWNTSALPDTAVVTAATLRAFVSLLYNDDSRSLSADWYSSWPIDGADYRETPLTSALNNHPISAISTGDSDFALTNPGTYVSKTGYTGLRLHVSGGQPNGRNQVNIRAYESTTSPEPRLLVTYSTPPVVSSVSDTPDPVTAGDPLTFSASWTDTDPGDSVRTVICKTNQINAGGSCPGGYWGYGNLSATSPSTASFTPTALHHGTQTYYAFACDAAGACSNSISGTFTVQNRAPTIWSVSHAPDPVTAGNPITFNAWWSDPADSARAVICKTDQVNASACPGGTWAVGALSSSSPSTVSFTPWNIDVGTQTYYAFACDAAGACSSSLSGTFEVEPSPLMIDELFVAVGQRVPGFGGVYVDETAGELHVLLTNPSQAAAASAQPALVEILGDASLGNLVPVPHQAQYSFAQLKEWHNEITFDFLAIPGAVLTDVDDERNRIVLGMENVQAQGPAASAIVSAAGVPAEAVLLEEREPITPDGLRDHHRPVIGGLQIEGIIRDDNELGTCTLGFNAQHKNEAGQWVEGFVTASHCSNVRYGNDHTMFWQPAWTANTTVTGLVGEEGIDPPPFTYAADQACDPGYLCRYSDAAFIRAVPALSREQGYIARMPEGSSAWDHVNRYRIVSEHKPVKGQSVIKVGQSTGRTSGDVVEVCVYSGGGEGVVLLCQFRAEYNRAKGDSGAAVFFKTDKSNDADNRVELAGVHWARGRNDTGWFSSITGIQRPTDLGKLCTVTGC